jgi:hypothetical protein
MEEISIEGKKIKVTQAANEVLLQISRDRLTQEDIQWLDLIASDLGKWEETVAGVKALALEIGIGNIAAPPNFETRSFEYKKFPKLAPGFPNQEVLEIHLDVSDEERTKRTNQGISITIKETDVINELNNVPKWRALKKAAENFRSILA